MAQKTQEKGAAGAAPVAQDPSRVRNVVLVGPSGVGKTTLVESLLVATGTINRAGSVAEGTTVCDYDPAAVRQQRSVGLAAVAVQHRDVKINILDTPGYADFLGEVRAGLRGADAVLFVVSAVDGIDAAAVSLWEECAAVGAPRAVLISRLDHQRADADAVLAACRDAFGTGVQPLFLPAGGQEQVTALLGVLDGKRHEYGGGTPTTADPDDTQRDAIESARGDLIEAIIAESEDEALMESYLSGEELPDEVVRSGLAAALGSGGLHPVVPVCAATGVGLDVLLDLVVDAFPPPTARPLPPVTTTAGQAREGLSADAGGPLVAQVIKTTVDPYVGRVSLLRVFSGTLRPDTTVHITASGLTDSGRAGQGAEERIAHVYSPLGANQREVPLCVAGDICTITKSAAAETGDTLSTKDDQLVVAPWQLPEPLLPVAVVPKSRSDEDALAKSLARLVTADPTVRLERNAETRQQVLWCTGDAHSDMVLERLRASGADVETVPVRVALRETFASTVTGHGRHVKQTGGHGQYAICDIRVEPMERGAGYEFASEVVGGAVPTNYIPSVDKGVRAQMEKGLVAGYPVVDIRVVVFDGKAHSVDSSDAAFQTAGSLALKDAAAKGQILLLEPVDEVTIRVPDSYVGTVMSDLSGRRGRVQGTEQDPSSKDRTLIRAEVPAMELLRYPIELRAMTSGAGTFTRSFARYEPMPQHLADQVRKEHAAQES